MQTFLPYPTFRDAAQTLDRQRLGKQRVETYQIMITLVTGRGWVYHPAVKMWRGYEEALMEYQSDIVAEWTSRDYKDTCLKKTYDVLREKSRRGKFVEPFWLGDYAFHRSHQSNLVAKKPEHYRPIFPTVPDDLEYIWPVN